MTAKKFSLVELLITLSIILVLSAMLMPMLNRARETAKSTSCKGNMKQSLTALFIYLDTYEVVSTQRWTDTLLETGLVLPGSGKTTPIKTYLVCEESLETPTLCT